MKRKNKGFIPLETIGQPEKRKRFLSGFTLIELLIVSALLAVVSLALFSVFNSGIKIWQRINQTSINEDLNIFLSKFARDLANGFSFSAINFSGDAERMQFAA